MRCIPADIDVYCIRNTHLHISPQRFSHSWLLFHIIIHDDLTNKQEGTDLWGDIGRTLVQHYITMRSILDMHIHHRSGEAHGIKSS